VRRAFETIAVRASGEGLPDMPAVVQRLLECVVWQTGMHFDCVFEICISKKTSCYWARLAVIANHLLCCTKLCKVFKFDFKYFDPCSF
jgi:hypothetical protein